MWRSKNGWEAAADQLDELCESSRLAHRAMKNRLTVQARAALKLHGRYLGYIRRLTGKQKAEVRKIQEAKGVRAAIARAKEFSNA